MKVSTDCSLTKIGICNTFLMNNEHTYKIQVTLIYYH